MTNREAVALGRLTVRQSEQQRGLNCDLDKYDLVLSTLSWESRCTFALSALHAKVDKLHAFRFETTDRERDARKSVFLSEFRSISGEFIEVQLGRSSAYASNVRTIEEFLVSKVLSKKRPLRVLCDITCFPKSYILVLLGMGFEKGYFAKFDCTYSEGNYAAVEGSISRRSSSEHGPISEGKWDSLSIPFFEADTPIPKSRDVLVTLGGEVGLTVPFIEKYEPTRLQIVGIDRSFGEQDSLREILKEPNVYQTKFDVCDTMRVAKHAIQFCDETREDVVTALAVGSKPHALGLGIAGLNQRKMEIVCRVPKRYTMMDIPANGRVMLYEIEDRFEPHAYL